MKNQTVHIIPVGFDYDRLIAPLIRDKVEVDRAILLQGAIGTEENVEYSKQVTRKLKDDFASLLNADTEVLTIDDVYDYDAAYSTAYQIILDEYEDGNDVYVNISAMPRTVSFAFTMAAHAIMVEMDAAREHIHTYYTAPEKYLETELGEELEKMNDLLDRISSEDLDPELKDEINTRLKSGRKILKEFNERGTTIGAKEFGDSHIVEIPVVPLSKLKPFERIILFKLDEINVVESVSELADILARELEEPLTDSFRSKVIYNTRSLREKGYIEQVERGKSHETRLSRLGKLWVNSHSREG